MLKNGFKVDSLNYLNNRESHIEYLEYALRHYIPDDICREILLAVKDLFNLIEQLKPADIIINNEYLVKEVKGYLGFVERCALNACKSIEMSSITLVDPLEKLEKNRQQALAILNAYIITKEKYEQARKQYLESLEEFIKDANVFQFRYLTPIEKHQIFEEYKSAVRDFRYFNGLLQFHGMKRIDLSSKE